MNTIDCLIILAPKLDNEFCRVLWSEMTAKEVFNLYRATYSFKNIHTTFNNEPVKLLEIAKLESDQNDVNLTSCQPPGHLFYCKKSKKLLCKCADGKNIEIKQLTLGKKMSAADFNNGFLKKIKDDERCFR